MNKPPNKELVGPNDTLNQLGEQSMYSVICGQIQKVATQVLKISGKKADWNEEQKIQMEMVTCLLSGYLINLQKEAETLKNVALTIDNIELQCARCEKEYKISEWKTADHWKNCTETIDALKKNIHKWEKKMQQATQKYQKAVQNHVQKETVNAAKIVKATNDQLNKAMGTANRRVKKRESDPMRVNYTVMLQNVQSMRDAATRAIVLENLKEVVLEY
jgi:hypothetical protein